MKTKYILFLFLCAISSLSAQVGIGTTSPNAALDVESSNDGFLVPRLALTATNVATVLTPTISELVYNTSTSGVAPNNVYPGYYYWDGTQWIRLATGSNSNWSVSGNTGTNPTTNFLGTTDNQDLVFRTNNIENMRINTNGNVGIGSTSNVAKLYLNTPSTDNTTNYGINNYFDGAETAATFGIRNLNYGSGNNTKYGIYNYVNTEGTGARFGIYSSTAMNSASNSNAYGVYNLLNAYGTGNHWASYNNLNLHGVSISDNYASYNLMNVSSSSNTSTIYGEYSHVDYSSGVRYGEYKNMNTNATYSTQVYGDYNNIYGSGNDLIYGVYNNLAASGTGEKIGVRNEFADVSGAKFGVYNYFPSGTATGTIYGVYNNIQNDADAAKYATYNYISGGEGSLRGSYNSVIPSATNSSTIYGVYGYVSSAGTGIHYGGYFNAYGDNNIAIYGTNSHATGWAGYFIGNGYWDGDMIFNESGTNDHDFRIESDTRTNMLWVDADENLVRFGTTSIASDSQNGTTVSGITVDYVADFDNEQISGTAVGIGSVEYLLDLSAETTINNRFSPSVDNTYDLGSATLRWDDVYATNGVIVTSDKREKEQIAPLQYGLEEILKLKPVTYKWKRNKIGSTSISDSDKEVKLGLIAQEVQQVLPEVVQTHDWKVLSEEQPNVYAKVEMERLGMSYQEIVPVLIKAVQEQTEIIEKQNSKIDQLEKEIEEIKQLLQSR